MKNIKHTTADGIAIYRIARKHHGKVFYSKTWLLIRWENRKAFYFGLGRNLKAAEKRAAQIDALTRSGTQSMGQIKKTFPSGRPRPIATQAYSTVGELMDVLVEDGAVLNLDVMTARSYANSLIKVVREALELSGKRQVLTAEVRAQSAQVLSDSTFTDFRRVRAKRAKESNDRLKEASALRSANKDIRQAKAALSEEAQKRFSERGLRFPDFKPWRAVLQFGGVEQKYRLPPVEVVRAIMTKIKDLDAGSNLWRACMLAAHAGLRPREIAFARWSWFMPGTKHRIEVRREPDFVPKRNHERSIEVAPWVFEALKAHENADESHVISGDTPERLTAVSKLAVKFLREAGLEVGKPVHELRKWFGSWVSSQRGLTTAQRQLGHDSYTTTEKHYRDINFPEEQLSFLWEK